MDKLQAMYKNQIAPAMEKADKLIVDKIPQTKLIQDKGVPPSAVVAGVGVVSTFIFAFIIGGAGLCNIVGFVFPVIGSYKALKSDGKEDDTNWLTYWVVYSFFNVVESITDLLFEWIPLYYLVKCAFLVWCFLPQFQGANIIYRHGLEPLLDKYIPQIEKASLSNVEKVKEVVRSVSSEGGDDNTKTD